MRRVRDYVTEAVFDPLKRDGPPEFAPFVKACPEHFAWTFHRTMYQQSGVTRSGSFEDYCKDATREGDKEATRRTREGKLLYPAITHSSYLDKDSSGDLNVHRTYFVWLDCDGAGSWDRLKELFKAAGLAAFFQQSKSRSEEKWHVTIPLSEPFVFSSEAGRDERRKLWKDRYSTLVAALSAYAGFDGVSGKEGGGFDLATDRLAHMMFLPCRSEDRPRNARVEVLQGGALDLDAILEAVGFDPDAVEKARVGDRKPPRRKHKLSSRWNNRVKEGGSSTFYDKTSWGSLGQALLSEGMVGDPKDTRAYRARCPWHGKHSSGEDCFGYALYFPDSDSFWCASQSYCRPLLGRESHLSRFEKREQLVKSLSPKARRVYQAVSRKSAIRDSGAAALPTKSWAELAGVVPKEKQALKDWYEQQQRSGTQVDAALEAMVGSLMADEAQPDAILSASEAMAGSEGMAAAVRALKRYRDKKGRVAQRNRLRQLVFGPDLYDLVNALVAFDRQGFDEVKLRDWYRKGIAARGDRPWLHEQAETVGYHDRTGARFFARPADCCVFHDNVIADGKEVGKRTMVCETTGCANCWHRRVLAEAELCRDYWADLEENLFYVAEITFPNAEALTRFAQYANRFYSPSQFTKLTTVSREGLPRIVYFSHGVGAPIFHSFAKRIAEIYLPPEQAEKVTVRGLKRITRSEALMEFRNARQAIGLYHNGLIKRRDRERLGELLDFLRPMKPTGKRGNRQLVTKSKNTPVPVPTRAQVREHFKRNGQEIDLTEADFVVYELVHTDSETPLDRSERPHTIDQARVIFRSHAYNTSDQHKEPEIDLEWERERERHLMELYSSQGQETRFVTRE
jgi:hypothetical protein